MTSLERAVGIGLATGRIAIGAGLWLAPRKSAKALGFDDLDQTGMALARIAATRDLVLGVWQLSALGDHDELVRASRAVAAADGGDALTFALGIASGDDAARTAGARGIVPASAATVAGLWLSKRLSQAQIHA